MAMPCKSSLPEDSHRSVTGIGRSPEDREIRVTTPVSQTPMERLCKGRQPGRAELNSLWKDQHES
jgi:hypothetical protein